MTGCSRWHRSGGIRRSGSFGCVGGGLSARGHNRQPADTSELRLESHRLGEPDAALFTIDPGYEEVAPIEAQRRVLLTKKASQVYLDRLAADPSLKALNEASLKRR